MDAPHITELRERGYAVVRGFLPHTVHGSATNFSVDRDRRLILNSFVRASDSPSRGEWAFRGGVSMPLGPEPQICRFEDLHDHPEPFYIEEDWIEEGTGV